MLHIRFPMGNPIGEPGKPRQQRRILLSALEVLTQLRVPGHLVELPYRWRRMAE
jgi:D-proline reductase (dithiol) PrdB